MLKKVLIANRGEIAVRVIHACKQLGIAGGEALPFSQTDVKFEGHAIECRINAEDSDNGFLPSPGKVDIWSMPTDNGARIDTHLYTGYSVPAHYDSLVAKVIVHEGTRNEAIRSMLRTLNRCKMKGIAATIPFHKKLLQDDRFREGRIHTKFVEEDFLRQGEHR